MEDPAGFTRSEHSDIFILRGENQPAPGLDEILLELELAARGKDESAVVRRPRWSWASFRRPAT